jgi:hypothetical protein
LHSESKVEIAHVVGREHGGVLRRDGGGKARRSMPWLPLLFSRITYCSILKRTNSNV